MLKLLEPVSTGKGYNKKIEDTVHTIIRATAVAAVAR